MSNAKPWCELLVIGYWKSKPCKIFFFNKNKEVIICKWPHIEKKKKKEKNKRRQNKKEPHFGSNRDPTY